MHYNSRQKVPPLISGAYGASRALTALPGRVQSYTPNGCIFSKHDLRNVILLLIMIGVLTLRRISRLDCAPIVVAELTNLLLFVILAQIFYYAFDALRATRYADLSAVGYQQMRKITP